MVFRGKPSKACQRCRERKLRCDLRQPDCGACLRAGARCYGYRDTHSLRIADETRTVRSKTIFPRDNSTSNQPKIFNLNHLPLDLQVQARELFIAYYINDFSRSWSFLHPYLNSKNPPEHVSLSMDAVSLAFLSHHVTSTSAQNLGRSKYVSALRKTNSALRCTHALQDSSTLDATLLLDLFEKIANPGGISEKAQRAHIDGSLALVKLRGLNHFTDRAGLKKLTRLTLNVMINCTSHGYPLPPELFLIRNHLSHYVDTKDPKFRSVGVIFQVKTPGQKIGHDYLSPWENVKRCTSLDQELEKISEEASPTWSRKRIFTSIGDTNPRVLDHYYDIYDSRITTQMWNSLRISRLLLCEEIIESTMACQDEESVFFSDRAKAAISQIISEVCASVPQMTDCEGAARSKLPLNVSACNSSHVHTLSHFLDNYVLLYALYVGAWSRNCPTRERIWIISQLKYISEHFRIKEALLVANILQDQMEDAMSQRPQPWNIYKLLGSYAFAA